MERASGGVIRHADHYLVLQYDLGHWGFVKGHIEADETPVDAFLREAYEETGLTAQDLSIIPGFHEKIHYFYKKGGQTIFKEVQYFLADSRSRTIALSFEHKTYLWLPFMEAIKTITFPEDREILEKAHAFLYRAKK